MGRSRPFRRAIVLGALAAAACAHRPAGANPAVLRLSTNPEVRWEPGAPRELAVILENRGREPVSLAVTAAHVAVRVFEPEGETPICEKAPEPGRRRREELAPGERRAFAVHLDACDVAPGEYRYEAWYALRGAPGAAAAERVGPERGRLVVDREGAAPREPAARAPRARPRRPGAR